MVFRKATIHDVKRITQIYENIHDEIESEKMTIGWIRHIYPTKETALSSIQAGDMFVEEDDGIIVAAAKINQEQVAEYKKASWQYEIDEEQVMVLHTLVVDPQLSSKGYGTKFVAFYEQYALNQNCHYLRMDTNAKNTNARKLYQKLNYQEVSIIPCIFNGIPNVDLVCLEKKI